MIEMLGMLAIVSLLSLGSFWGIRQLRIHEKANELAFTCTQISQDVLTSEKIQNLLEGSLIEEVDSIQVFSVSSDAFVLSLPPVSEPICRVLLPLFQNDYRVWIEDTLWNGNEAACVGEAIQIQLERSISGIWDELDSCEAGKVPLFSGGCGCPADKPLLVKGECSASCPPEQKAGSNGLCCAELNEEGKCCQTFYDYPDATVCCEKGETAYTNAYHKAMCCPASSKLSEVGVSCWDEQIKACCPVGFSPLMKNCNQPKCCADEHFYDLSRNVAVPVCCGEGYIGYSPGYNGYCCPVHLNYHLDIVISKDEGCWYVDLKTCCPEGYIGYLSETDMNSRCSREKRCCPVQNLVDGHCSGGDIATYEGASNGQMIDG